MLPSVLLHCRQAIDSKWLLLLLLLLLMFAQGDTCRMVNHCKDVQKDVIRFRKPPTHAFSKRCPQGTGQTLRANLSLT